MGILGNRFGLAGIVAAVLGTVIVWQQLAGAAKDVALADEQRQVAILQAALTEQNGAVVTFQEAAARDQAERAARALRVLVPRQKPNPKTAEELNRWLAASP